MDAPDVLHRSELQRALQALGLGAVLGLLLAAAARRRGSRDGRQVRK